MLLSCPSKTFLLGEYLALKGEACLLVGTEPRFDLRIREGKRSAPFHPESPAGKLWARNEEATKDWSLEFRNSLRIGGIGASSAEFLLLWTALQMRKTLSVDAQLEPDVFAMLKTYAELSAETGVKPSGADIVAQLKGNVTLFEKNSGTVEMRGWGFDGLSFVLVATGTKVATHEHLRTLGEWDETALKASVVAGIEAWRGRDSAGFIDSVRQTRAELKKLNFEAPTTTSLILNLQENPKVIAAKGCGALGADVVLALCKTSDREALAGELSARWTCIATDEELCEGLSVISSNSPREVHA